MLECCLSPSTSWATKIYGIYGLQVWGKCIVALGKIIDNRLIY